MKKVAINHEDIILNVYLSKNRASKCIKQKLTENNEKNRKNHDYKWRY